ncbi:hypothetical protein N7499_012041 [Penicillium canescens]|uniref:Subtelomeric hrmA-associated cluster protein AFUB-079030/YDR124W-like helical bundle domain-containing protein n=1 Tax=Penicillium canescens TaxID=5083 RepID=A0AAD6IL77_PENCN|nr:uncharacterized protein N7446_007316 [Penicillium canescens]KAJ5991389.1 hypothetical protein N7522_011596 [Penicillium canescens]KAJ6052674.1 hypothetical protein N7460_003208 [Penicillium canescens]KAJ6063196.1 hypothetical protein N7446_007316 [Penicillium canescens]KAJ6070154.1 hypothetical protein N7499_012041 [Penicillium canescens]
MPHCGETVGIQGLNTGPYPALIPVSNSTFLRRYYERRTNCRVIAKAYVKVVEPRKQVQYPYNGRKTGGHNTANEPRRNQATVVATWERIALLVHILCELRLSHGITAQKLKLAEQPTRRLISPMERSLLLDELYAVRDAEEKFLESLTGRSLQLTV